MVLDRLPWHRRLEARVIASVILLVALSLGAILVAATRVVTSRSLDRMAADLDAAGHAFHRLVSERAEFASAQSALITALPVFRAHLTDPRLAEDAATVEAMADLYRQQLKASFTIVGGSDGRWIAAPGWPRDAKPVDLASAIGTATAGTPARRFVVANDRLFLVVAEPAGFADEVLGTLTVGYALDDDFAKSLAQVTGGQINFVGGGRVYASSLPAEAREGLASALAQDDRAAATPGFGSLRHIGSGDYAFSTFPLSLDGASDAPARLMVLEDWAPVQAFLNQLRWRLLGTGTIIFAVALGVGVFFSRRLARPLQDLATAAQDIAGGNWTRQLAVRGSAEEARMAQAVNAMTTSLRHWYEEAKTRDDQLRQAQKVEALGRLAGGVAHDFNNFLTAIKGYGEMLLDSFEATDRRRSKAEGILKAADTAAGLTRQLLVFSRKRVVTVQVLSLGRLLKETQKLLKRLIGEDIDLRTTMAPNVGAVKADPHHIEQVLLNLVVNARDAMPRGGSIDIELSDVELGEGPETADLKLQPGHYVRLTVRDTGCGMTPDVKARIFEPFFTTKQEGAGTGLGLAVVFGIVEQAGGAVTVDTELNRGTSFHVYFPRTAEVEAEAAPAPSADSAKGSETVLLVEDEPQVAELVNRALQKSGYTVLRASRGAEALEIVRSFDKQIDLLLTDIVMPGMNGRELSDRVRLLKPDIKVLYMSGYSDDAVLRHGVETATMHFLAKPFSIKALTSKVREALTESRQLATT